MKRAKKEIMAMVMEEIKGKGDTAKPKESKAEQASNSLLALVRGERKRGAASMLGVDLKRDSTEFVPSRREPAVETALMIPRPWTNAQEFRPVRGNSVDDKGASNKESGNVSSNMEQNMSLTEKEKINLTKTDPLSIKNPKKKIRLKSSAQKRKNFRAGKIVCLGERNTRLNLALRVWSQEKAPIPI